jgi:hypothetical protein
MPKRIRIAPRRIHIKHNKIAAHRVTRYRIATIPSARQPANCSNLPLPERDNNVAGKNHALLSARYSAMIAAQHEKRRIETECNSARSFRRMVVEFFGS